MNQGLYIAGHGIFPMCHRYDLNDPALQVALKDKHSQRRAIGCLCRHHEGVILEMESICGDPDYRVDRRLISDDHAKNCIFRLVSDTLAKESRQPSSWIFAPPKQVCTASQARGGDTSDQGARSAGFSTYGHAMFSGGYTAACRQAFPDRRPSAKVILARIKEHIERTPLLDVSDGFRGAARTRGELAFGLILDPLPAVGANLAAPCHIMLWRADRIEGELLRWHGSISTDLLARARDQVRIFENTITPPYFFVAVLEPDGRVRRLVLHAVYYDGCDLCYVDSNYERGYAAHLNNLDTVHYKAPISLADYQGLPPDLQIVALPKGQPWPYTPDFLIYYKPNHIVELRGFKIDDPVAAPYHELLERKGPAYLQLAKESGAKFLIRDGWKYANTVRASRAISADPVKCSVFPQRLPNLIFDFGHITAKLDDIRAREPKPLF